MAPEMDDKELNSKLVERFKSLPKPVQNAINSASVEEHLRTLANTHQLHLDQWQLLENEVMLTLLGFQEPSELKQRIKDDLVVNDAIAAALEADISSIVFAPIRQELERELDHPDAQVREKTGVEKMTTQALASDTPSTAPIPAPIAPLPTPPETKAVRAPISEVYKPGETSSTRKDIVNDPYRVPPV
jgi:hypothetical protein